MSEWNHEAKEELKMGVLSTFIPTNDHYWRCFPEFDWPVQMYVVEGQTGPRRPHGTNNNIPSFHRNG